MSYIVWAAITEYRRLGNSKHLFLTSLEAVKSKIKVPADLVSEESHLPGLCTAVFSYPHMVESSKRRNKLSYKATNIKRAPPL